jgi:hypothetical protein
MKLRNFALIGLALALLVGGVAASAQSTQQQGGVGRIRIIHASPGTPNVDVYLGRSPTPLVTNLAFGINTGFITLPVATYFVTIRPAGAPPETAPMASGTFVNSEGFAGNVVIIGLLDRQGSRSVRFMEVPVNFDPVWGRARVQVIHASPDTPRIDLVANNFVAMDGLLYGDGLFTGISFAPGAYNLSIVASPANLAGTLTPQPTPTVQPTPGARPVFINIPNMPLAGNTLYTLIVVGLRQDIHPLVLTDVIPLPPPPSPTPVPTWTPTPFFG